MTRYITLYIEDDEIKLLVTKDTSVEKWASLVLEPGLVSEGIIIDQDLVATRITELLKLQGVSTGTVIASLSGLNCIFRVITLPEIPRNLIHESVYNEASRVIPIPLEQVYLHYQLIPSSPGETRVFLVAVPRNSTDAMFETLSQAGLNIDLLDVAPLALCRNADVPKAIIVNSWLSNADIAIMVDRIPQVMRSVSLITESTDPKDKLANIAEELNRTVTFYNSSHSDDPLDSNVPVLVSGDLAHEDKLWPELVQELGSNVSVLPSTVTGPEAFDASQFMVNIGLVSKVTQAEKADASFSIVNINAIPDEYRPKGISWASIFAPVFAVVVIGALVYGWIFVQNTQAETTELQNELTNVETQLSQEQATIPPLQSQISQLQASIPPMEATAYGLVNTFNGLTANRALIVEDIRIALDLVSGIANVHASEIGHDGSVFTLVGTATKSGNTAAESLIFAYARELRNTGRFEHVIVSSITSNITGAFEEGEPETEILTFTFILIK